MPTAVRVEVDGPVGRLTLARPEKLNALSPAVLEEIVAAAQWFDARPDVPVVVVAGEGRAFCAGFDLDTFAAGGTEGAVLGAAMAEAVESMRAVTVAAVHGHCVGGGVVLAVACDLRIAADDARFAIPEVDLGIPLAWGGVPRLVREVGPATTRDLVLTCRTVAADEARALGLVQRVVPAASLGTEADELARSLATKAPIVLRQTLRHVAAATNGEPFDDVAALAEAVADPHARSAALAYLARRGARGE